MAKKRSECQIKKVGFFYVPQWKTSKDAVLEKSAKKTHAKKK